VGKAHLTIVLAALAVSRWTEHFTGWSIRRFASSVSDLASWSRFHLGEAAPEPVSRSWPMRRRARPDRPIRACRQQAFGQF
jgi:hypothetical protein